MSLFADLQNSSAPRARVAPNLPIARQVFGAQLTRKSSFFIVASFAALASFARFFAGFLIGGNLQIVPAVFGVVAIAAAGGLIAIGMIANRDG